MEKYGHGKAYRYEIPQMLWTQFDGKKKELNEKLRLRYKRKLRWSIEEIIDFIEDCLSSGEKTIFIIHGYRNGQVLKNYLRSKEFLEDMKEEGYKLKELKHPKPGASMFKII